MSIPHMPVLLAEVLEAFEGKIVNVFIDGTLGAGGHAKAILEAHPEIKHYIGIDQDPDAIAIARERLAPWKDKVQYRDGNFAEVIPKLVLEGVRADGILLDLGVSSMQLDRAERGFSFMNDGPLDMRMNPKASLTAEEVVNEWTEEAIARVFRDYGEEKRWRSAAKAVVEARKKAPITTTRELADVLMPALDWKKKGINPLTLCFQGLRICVNRELDVLRDSLPVCLNVLVPGGRLAVITFHSLEDRIVKNIFRDWASDKVSTSGIGGIFIDKDPVATIVTRKAVKGSEAEIKDNPRSRSAKLRVSEKI